MTAVSRTPGRPFSLVEYNIRYLKRDDCPTCSSRRDNHGRLPIGWCGDGCLMARIRRNEVRDHIVVE